MQKHHFSAGVNQGLWLV